jgi:autotransporter translocation and assembly factor TamB
LRIRTILTARRIAAISGAIIVVALLAVATFHSRPVRARVLATAIAWLARTGYVARVGAIDYNLLTLTVHLSDVTLAASSTPFFSAKEVHASFPSRIVFGRIDITRMEIVAPRITLLRDADGRDNWTTGANRPATTPPRIRIGRARISDLVLIWNDERTSTHVEAGGSLDLTPDGRDVSGPITLSRPAVIRWRDRETRVGTFAGRVSWNDRDLSLHAVSLRAPEGTIRADGRIESLLGDPRIDVRIVSDVDVAAISRWVTAGHAVAGTARGDAHVVGPLASPDLELTNMTAEIAGGSVTATGRASVDGPGAVRVEWKHLDLPALVKGAVGYTHRAIPLERLSGSLDAKWTAPRLDQLHLTAESRAIDTRGDPAGSSKLELRGAQFALSAEELVALGVRAQGSVQGTLNTDTPAHSPIRGSIDVQARDAASLTQALVRSGLIRTRPPIRGTAASAFVVSGTLGAPSLEGSLDAALQYASVPSTALRAHASISPREIRLSDIDVRLAGSSARGAVRWTIDSDEIDGTLSGSLRLEHLRDLTAALPRTLPLDGTLDLSAALSGSLAQPRVAMSGAGRALDVAGQRIDRLTAGARLTGSELAVDRLLLEVGAGRLDASGTFDLTRETYAARATAVDVPIHPVIGVAGDEPVPISGSLNGDFDGQGSFRHLGGRGRLSLVDARWRAADLGRIGSELTLAGRDVTFTFDAGDLALKGSGAVSIDPNGPVSLHGRWEPDDLAALARRLTIAVPLSSPGAASAGFELTGTRDRLADAHGVVTVDRVDVDIAEQSIRLVRPGRIESDGRRRASGALASLAEARVIVGRAKAGRIVRVDDIALATGSSNLTVTGSIGESAARDLTLTLEGSLSDFWFVKDLIQPRSTEAARLSPPTGSIRARLTAAGTLEQPRIAGSFQIAAGRIPVTDRASPLRASGASAGQGVTDLEVAAKYDEGVLIVERATAAFEGATLLASARVPGNVFLDRLPSSVRRRLAPAAGPATLSAQIRSITRSIAAPFVDAETLEQIALQADASIDLESDRLALDRVRGTVTLERAEISLAGVSFDQQTTTRLVVGDGRVTVDAWNWGRDDNRVALRGGITLGEDFALDLVATSALDLRLLNAVTPAAQVLGRADAELRLGGTVRSPTIDGYVTLSNGEARIANPRLIIGDITGTITLAADRLTLERLYATVNGGDAELAGSIRHVWLTPLDGRVTFTASGSSFDLTGLRAEADAALQWTLDSSGPALDGTVTLLRSAYREPLSLTGGLLNALRLSTTRAEPASPSVLDRTRLDVRLVTADDLIVDNNLARLTLRSDLRVVGTVSRPSVTGRATLGEGGVLFFGANRYRLSDQGSIDFANPNQIEPDLDVSAVTRVQGNEITLTLKGTPATLETTLTSDDKQQSQSEIVSLLLIGRTSDRGVGTASGGPGGNDLLGLLTGELVGAAGRAVGLDTVRLERGTPDVVRFDAGLVAAETNPGARLTFGKTIGSKAEVVFSQSLQQSGGLTWIVSYAPRSGIGLRAVSLDDGDRLYEFTPSINR